MFSKQGLFLNNMFYCRQFVLTAHTRRSDGPLDVSPARSRRAVSPSPVFSLGTTQDPPFQVVQIRILVKASPPSNGPLADAGDPARPDGGASGHGGGSPQMGQGSVGLPPHRGRGPGARVSRGRHLAPARTPRGGSRGPGTCVNLVPAEQRHPGTAEVHPLGRGRHRPHLSQRPPPPRPPAILAGALGSWVPPCGCQPVLLGWEVCGPSGHPSARASGTGPALLRRQEIHSHGRSGPPGWMWTKKLGGLIKLRRPQTLVRQCLLSSLIQHRSPIV